MEISAQNMVVPGDEEEPPLDNRELENIDQADEEGDEDSPEEEEKQPN